MTTSNIIFHPGTDDPELEAANIEMSKFCVNALLKLYPAHNWLINADIRGGIVNVINPEVSTTHCYTVVPYDWSATSIISQMKVAGGEILERAGLTRGRFNIAEIANAARDIRGNMKTEK